MDADEKGLTPIKALGFLEVNSNYGNKKKHVRKIEKALEGYERAKNVLRILNEFLYINEEKGERSICMRPIYQDDDAEEYVDVIQGIKEELE